ncbi:MAG TPA: ABC transporter substrate-binding protein, partial [Planctomycetota bacterium]|nr:ABC transporter substrate-binding protein [Planctomycetota bacterium]
MPGRRFSTLALLAAAAAAFLAPPAAGEDVPAPAPAGTPAAEPYGGTPEDLRPHRGAGEPLRRFFLEPPAYRGPGAEEPDPEDLTEVRFGVVLPLTGIDAPVGRRMRNGHLLAIEEANAAGGYRAGLPFRLLETDENDTWGAAGNVVVDLATRRGCWAVFGALDDQNSHVMTRVLLKINVPMINTGGTDPTLTEHNIPWLVRMRSDDRQISYRLL